MSYKDSFTGGFVLGTIVGGIVGGAIGAVIASRSKNPKQEGQRDSFLKSNYQSASDDGDSIESARLALEDKINQLNHAIDDVKVTLLKNSPAHESE